MEETHEILKSTNFKQECNSKKKNMIDYLIDVFSTFHIMFIIYNMCFTYLIQNRLTYTINIPVVWNSCMIYLKTCPPKNKTKSTNLFI